MTMPFVPRLSRFIAPALSLGALALIVAAPARADLTVKFHSGLIPADQAFILFDAEILNGTYSGGSLATKKSYSFADLSGGITLSDAKSVVGYISLQKPMTNDRTTGVSFDNPSDPDYHTRWDKFEFTYRGNSFDKGNLSSINSYAIPLSLTTSGGGQFLDYLTYDTTHISMVSTLSALTNGAAVLRDGNDLLRILGPSTYADLQGPYPSFASYYTSVVGTNAAIADSYDGFGSTSPATTPQDYKFTATFNADNITLTGGSDTAGGVGQGHTIIIPKSTSAYPDNLLKRGFYGNDPAYTVDGGDSHVADNTVYSAAVRDVLAGFAIGYVGSDVTDANTGQKFKDEESRNWFAANQTLAFSSVQPAHTGSDAYFNAYAEAINQNSNSYGFPFSDKLHKPVQISLGQFNGVQVDTMDVYVLGGLGSGLPSAAPEPGSLALLTLGFMGTAILRQKRRHS